MRGRYMDGHQRRRKRIENKIIQTAMDLFRKHGFKRVSIEEVAEKAAVSKVTLYKYFRNKPSLIRTCLNSTIQDKADEIRRLLTSNSDFLTKLESLMRSKVNLIESFDGDMFLELNQIDPEIIDELMEIRREAIVEVVSHLLEEGRTSGYISSAISNESLIVFFDVVGMGIVSSPIFKEYSITNPDAFDEIQKIAMSCLTSHR